MEFKNFEIVKQTAKNLSSIRRGKKIQNGYHSELPLKIGLKLTNRCNLRCKHCYEWGDSGYCRKMSEKQQKEELDKSIVQTVLEETKECVSGLYLWGGEPLLYSEFDFLCDCIAKEKEERIIAMCTNGILIPEKIDAILKLGSKLELVIALEGLCEENDQIRGRGVYNKVKKSISLLLDLRRQGIFKGKITIHTVINDKNCEHLLQYAKEIEAMGADMLLFCFPWYLSEETTKEMNRIYQEEFFWLPCFCLEEPSWNAFQFRIAAGKEEQILSQIALLKRMEWKMHIRIVPEVSKENLTALLNGGCGTIIENKKCNSIAMRMDILPDGAVTVCKHFKEFTIGNLQEETLVELMYFFIGTMSVFTGKL